MSDIGRWRLVKRGGGFAVHANNPTREQKASGLYYPRVTAIQRGRQSILKIEFSAPKLLYGNNVDELDESQFDEVVKTLRLRLKDMGLFIFSQDIASASVAAFHPSKNFLLTDNYTASYVISDLSKIGLPRRLDHSKVTFMNDGKSMQFYSAAHSLVFYDKIADLNKKKGRAVDKDQTSMQRSIFELLKPENSHAEMLRMEVRLSKKQKMNAVLTKLGHNKDPTFADIFCKGLNRAILTDYWKKLVADDHRFLLDRTPCPNTLLRALLRQGFKPKHAIYMIGLLYLGRDASGVMGLRTVLGEYTSPRDWPRRKADLQKLSEIHASIFPDYKGWRQQIEKGIESMEPCHLSEVSGGESLGKNK